MLIMCGIAGKIYFEKNRTVEFSELKRMTDSIAHRGPDDEGYYISKNIGLGFRRLSIIDLKSGHQPLSNSDGSIWITFNGEIYNFKELKRELQKKGYSFQTKTDTEVIVNLYEEYGEGCLKYLRGMFAFVIWDNRKKLIFGARDRFGIKPFYYYIDNEKFVYGSEIKAINKAEGIRKSIDLESLDSYLSYGYVTGKKSIFTTIKKLEPAHYFILRPMESSNITIHNYWDINFQPDYSKSISSWAEELQDTLKESIKMRMISDVPLGAFLSGGVDSSSVVALMSQLSDRPIKTFSIGFKEEKYNELEYARAVAKKYQTEHHEMIIEPESLDLLPKLIEAYDEPFADSSAIPTYYVSKFAREYVTVSLSGDGGDELFAGYFSYSDMVTLKKLPFNNSFFKHILSYLHSFMPDYIYGTKYLYLLSKNIRHIAAYYCLWKDYERKSLLNNDIKNQLNGFNAEMDKIILLNGYESDFLSSIQKLDMRTYLVDDILTKLDRASMINSLEARVPLLDHKVAELSFKIPSKFKIYKGGGKFILKEAMRQHLPNTVISHAKQGFAIPLKLWFRDDLKEYTFDILDDPSSNLYNYLNYNFVKTILGYHQKGMRDYSQKLWSLLFLNEWLMQNT